jgi:hypothetical protein
MNYRHFNIDAWGLSQTHTPQHTIASIAITFALLSSQLRLLLLTTTNVADRITPSPLLCSLRYMTVRKDGKSAEGDDVPAFRFMPALS